jgi:hypothetical protein
MGKEQKASRTNATICIVIEHDLLPFLASNLLVSMSSRSILVRVSCLAEPEGICSSQLDLKHKLLKRRCNQTELPLLGRRKPPPHTFFCSGRLLAWRPDVIVQVQGAHDRQHVLHQRVVHQFLHVSTVLRIHTDPRGDRGFALRLGVLFPARV